MFRPLRALLLLATFALWAGEPDVPKETLFQFSTIGALAEGVYVGELSIPALLTKGDLGLGTFSNLNGELVLLDGKCFQIKQDGSVHLAPQETGTPFAVATFFHPGHSMRFAAPTLEVLNRELDRLRISNNIPFAFRVQGRFESIRCRSVGPQPLGRPLAEAVTDQVISEYQNVEGTLVGFWFPASMKGINVPG